jgi:hypothetical protein
MLPAFSIACSDRPWDGKNAGVSRQKIPCDWSRGAAVALFGELFTSKLSAAAAKSFLHDGNVHSERRQLGIEKSVRLLCFSRKLFTLALRFACLRTF